MTRKMTFLILLTTLSLDCAFGQTELKVTKIKDEQLTKILNNIQMLTEKKTNELSICVFKVGNPSGSAGKESCEITHNLYIAVSEYDEYPAQNLFVFGPVYNPKTNDWTGKDNEQELTIEYGAYDSRQRITLKISLDKIEIKK